MAKGLAVPLRVNARGGTAVVSGDEQNTKVLMLALSNLDNDNAFQQDSSLSLGQRMIFEKATAGFRASVVASIVRIFAAFTKAKRFSIVLSSIKWESGPGRGEQTLTFKYVDLESEKTQDYRRTFGSSPQTVR